MSPGLALQRLTTREPTLDQLEVAIASLRAVMTAEQLAEVDARRVASPAGRSRVLRSADASDQLVAVLRPARSKRRRGRRVQRTVIKVACRWNPGRTASLGCIDTRSVALTLRRRLGARHGSAMPRAYNEHAGAERNVPTAPGSSRQLVAHASSTAHGDRHRASLPHERADARDLPLCPSDRRRRRSTRSPYRRRAGDVCAGLHSASRAERVDLVAAHRLRSRRCTRPTPTDAADAAASASLSRIHSARSSCRPGTSDAPSVKPTSQPRLVERRGARTRPSTPKVMTFSRCSMRRRTTIAARRAL